MPDTITHPTDFSPEAHTAFIHALALACAHRCRLDLLHVRSPHGSNDWQSFPHVREVLMRWGLMEAGAPTSEITPATGVTVRKTEISDTDPLDGLANYLWTHPADLVVMASHGRTGLNRWLAGSVTESIVRQTHLPTLVIGPNARPFVDPTTGVVNLARILMAVAPRPSAARAMLRLDDLLAPFDAARDFVHVGPDAPQLMAATGTPIPVRTVPGDPVECIVAEADSCKADVIVLTTSGRHGLLDLVRGGTSAQVQTRATCPVLTLPA